MKINKFEVTTDWILFGLKIKETFLAVWLTFVEGVSLVYEKHGFEDGAKMIVIGPIKIEWTP